MFDTFGWGSSQLANIRFNVAGGGLWRL